MAAANKRRRHTDMSQMDFYILGMTTIICKLPRDVNNRNAPIDDDQFTSVFGTSPAVVTYIWNLLKPYETITDTGTEAMEPKHILWGFLLLKTYRKEEQHCALAGGVGAKTFQKWAWLFVESIADLEPEVVSNRLSFSPPLLLSSNTYPVIVQILWENRKERDIANDCMVVLDGTDYMISLQFNQNFFGYKFRAPGLRYEIATCIRTGKIVWINGPYPPGIYNDLMVARMGIIHYLEDRERFEADDGYEALAPRYAKVPGNLTRDESKMELQQHVQRRHEQMNSQFKNWGVLRQRFWHLDLSLHLACFRAVAVILEVSLELGVHTVNDIDYRDT